ncbi:hypothetical protein ABIA39_001645 [Nocardia sp. GAS34]|uniref:ESX secretion-associated protein EspG n=1 Tax=unclassified Nocardia TaxID=2637762 RepID=UPI003D23BE11
MIKTWNLTDTELDVRWCELSGERNLPRPLYYTTRIVTDVEYQREVRFVSEQLKGKLDASFDAALSIMIDPDVRVGIHGFDGREPRNAAARIRVAAARKWERCVVITQIPGETIYHSGGYVVRECYATELARILAEQLPEVDAGGRGRVELADVGDQSVDDGWPDPDYVGVAERSEAFRSAPATTVGLFEIEQGSSRFGPRGVSRRMLEWRDLVDDGRYVIDDNRTVAVPADRNQLRVMINNGIGTIIGMIEDETGVGGSLRSVTDSARVSVTEEPW